jgi:hypothetical protein
MGESHLPTSIDVAILNADTIDIHEEGDRYL